jgi:WD40 repeat protein
MKKWNWVVFLLVIVFQSGRAAHADWGQNAQFAPDGKTMLAHHVLWSLPEGHEIRRYDAPFCALSPDGRSVVTGDGKTLDFWDVASGGKGKHVELQIGALDPRTAVWPLCALIPGGNEFMLATGDYKITLYIFDTQSGRLLRKIPTSADSYSDGRIAPDGKTFVLSGEENYQPDIEVGNLASGNITRRIKSDLEDDSKCVAAFSPDGKILAVGTKNKVARLMDAATGKTLREIGDKENKITALAFSPDARKLLIVTGDFISQYGDVWNVADGKQSCGFEIKPQMPLVNTAVFSSDGRFVALADDDEARVWEITQDAPPEKGQIRILPSGWSENTETAHLVARLDPAHDAVWNVAFSSGGKYALSAGRDTRTDAVFVRVWNAGSGTLLHRFAGVRGAFSPDESTFALAGEDGSLCLMDLKTGGEIRTLEKLPAAPSLLAFSPSGKVLVAQCGEGDIRLLDAEGKVPAREFDGANAVLSSGNHWLAFNAGTEFILDKDFQRVPGHGPNSTFQFTSRLEVLDLTAPDILDQAPARAIDTIHEPGWIAPQPQAFTNDGTRLLMRSGAEYLWNINDPLPAHTTSLKESDFSGVNAFLSAAFSPLGSFLAGVTKDGRVRVIDVDSQTAIREFPGNCVLFSPDGKAVLVGTRSGEAKLYKIATGEQVQYFQTATEKTP